VFSQADGEVRVVAAGVVGPVVVVVPLVLGEDFLEDELLDRGVGWVAVRGDVGVRCSPHFAAMNLRCQAKIVAGWTGKISCQRRRGSSENSAATGSVFLICAGVAALSVLAVPLMKPVPLRTSLDIPDSGSPAPAPARRTR
jgi:hypothetical protein